MPGGAQRRRGWVTHALFDGAPVAARRAGCAHDLGLGQPRFAPSHHWLRPARFACRYSERCVVIDYHEDLAVVIDSFEVVIDGGFVVIARRWSWI